MMNIPTLQIPAAQIQANTQQPQPPLNLNMNMTTLPQYALNMQYILVNPQQYAMLQLQQLQLQQALSNANTAYPATSIVFLPQPLNQMLIPHQNVNYMPNPNMANIPMTMQNHSTTVYPTTQSKQSPINMNMNMNMNMNTNMNMAQNLVHSNMARNNNMANNANSRSDIIRGDSPRLSPKLSSISEEKTFDDHECISNEQYLNPSASVFTPSPPSSPSLTPISPQYSANKVELVAFNYPPRAQLNIFIHKNLTKDLLDIIYEQFPNSERLYYYLDISTALQINDDQMYIFEYEDNDGEQVQIILVNYDLHCKESGDALYGFVTANKGHAIKQNKWMWKLDKFMTAAQIENTFGIKVSELPKSSRMTPRFQNELKLQSQCIKNMRLDIIDNTDWFNIQQIKSLRRDNKRNKKYLQIVAKINELRWIEQCKKLWHHAPAIPIVVKNKNGSNKHWIEWVKLISIDEIDNNGNKLYVGVSCKYSDEYNKWEIKSICLDKGDIENKHRLVGLGEDEKERYLSNFYNFHTTIAEIQWIRSN